jgi:hypothetical protein
MVRSREGLQAVSTSILRLNFQGLSESASVNYWLYNYSLYLVIRY